MEAAETEVDDVDAPSAKSGAEPPASAPPAAAASAGTEVADLPKAAHRRPGKQPGAPGFGRTQVLTAHETVVHRPADCAGGAAPLAPDGKTIGYGGFQSLDLVWDETSPSGWRLPRG